mgnify:CR=1 FL=1
MAERKINMSIAEKVATQFNSQDASYIGLDGKLCLFRDIVSDAGGVFLRATTPDDEINSIYTNPQGWVFGFSDGLNGSKGWFIRPPYAFTYAPYTGFLAHRA